MEKITKQIQYTPEDLQKSYNVHYIKNFPIRSRMVMYLGFFIIVVGMLLFALTYYSATSSTTLSIFYIFFGIATLIYYFWSKLTLGKRMFKKITELKYEYDIELNKDGALIKGKNITSEIKWEHFQKAIVTKEIVLLYPNPMRFNFFPKKYFTEQEYEQLCSWVIDFVPNIKK
ncbi:MAG: YcxB family protein [Bacteroidetes bacterium]|nr:YcxB family protein [Bacteroidota bacterium]